MRRISCNVWLPKSVPATLVCTYVLRDMYIRDSIAQLLNRRAYVRTYVRAVLSDCLLRTLPVQYSTYARTSHVPQPSLFPSVRRNR